MLNIAVSGANGFVGQKLSETFVLNPNINLLKVGRHNPGNYKNFINLETDSVESICSKLSGYDCFIHLAARAHSKNATAEDFQRDNVDLSKKLAEIAANSSIKQFIYLSSIKVLGNSTEPGKPFKATDIPRPTDLYGKSKLACEIEIARILQGTNTHLTIIRPPLVWGERCKGNLAVLVKMIDKKLPIPVGAIKNRRDLISLENLCEVIKQAMLVTATTNRTFLVSDGKARSTKEIIALLETFTTEKALVVKVPNIIFQTLGLIPALRDKVERFFGNLEVDISETQKHLNWTPLA